MFEDKIKDEIQSSVAVCFGEHVKGSEINVEKPADRSFGDFSSNISFTLVAKLKKSPSEIAETLAADLTKIALFKSVAAVKGFINFTLSHERYVSILNDVLSHGSRYGSSDALKGNKIQVEFISANPTGPLTLANGRGGFGGDVLANVLTRCGAKVDREYYINDGGNQINILGQSILAALELGPKTDELYRGEYIDVWAKENESLVKKHKDSPMALGEIAGKDILEKLIAPAASKMGIEFDNWFSEKAMIDRGEVEEAIAKFTKYGLTEEKDGALWLKTTKFGDDKDRVLVKADGEKTYFANDAAYHFDKLYKRKYDKVINFWGADHHGYVGRMLAAVEAMGCPDKLKIVIFQMVRLIKDGQEFRMSKRRGTFITMEDLFELIGSPKSEQEFRDASDVARFFFLSRSFNTHMDFDLDLAKERSDKNPVFYVKYAHARMHGILANFTSQKPDKKPDHNLLTAEAELDLIDKISELPGLIEFIASADNYPVHLLSAYAIEISKKFHHFYDKCRVIDEEKPELTLARISLVRATQTTLHVVGHDLLGLSMPERM